MLGEIIAVSMNPLDRFREFGLGLAAMKYGQVVALIDECFDHERADEAGAADDENPHFSTISGPRLTLLFRTAARNTTSVELKQEAADKRHASSRRLFLDRQIFRSEHRL